VDAQRDPPEDLLLFLDKAEEMKGAMYVFPDVSTLQSLVTSQGKGTSKRRRTKTKSTPPPQEQHAIANLICSDAVGDKEYQEMLQEFFSNVPS
jgi:hypothetical protein